MIATSFRHLGMIAMFFSLLGITGCADSSARRIPSFAGPEDLVNIGTAKKPIIATGTTERCNGEKYGRIEFYEPGDVAFSVAPLNRRFSPVGLVFVSKANTKRKERTGTLYVTDSLEGKVEILEVCGRRLTGVSRTTTPLRKDKVKRPNGIAVFDDGTIYVTGMSLWPKRKDDPTVVSDPTLLFQKNSVACYHPGKKCWETVLTGFNGANGIAPGPEGKSLLVCSYHSQRIWIFQRDPKTGLLKNEGRQVLPLELPFHPDNLKYVGDGWYDVCGQKGRLTAGLQLITRLPFSTGGWVRFHWDGKNLTSQDRSNLLKGHYLAPSTALEAGGRVYSGQPVSSGVFTRPMPAGSVGN